MITNGLWPHQARALQELDDAIKAGHRAICVTSPTGGGKTRMACTRLESSGVPSVFYTHRRMLLDQTARVFERHGFDFGLRASKCRPRLLADIQIAMIQTEVKAVLKTGSRELHDAREVLIDEAHNNAADTAQEIIKRHQDAGAVVIGFTATPLNIGHVYDHLIVAGTNSELRKCGAHVPAYHYGPDEPDKKLVGRVAIGEGECGIHSSRRMAFAHRVFGRVVENYRELNPHQTPTLLFAPGVEESIWFAEQLTEAGISAAHIDGKECWLNGERIPTSPEVREEIAELARVGDIKVVCNRFVLREGVDWPWIQHGIFATIFGSLTSYLQAGGRLLRAHESHDRVTIQDHGGNWWRHGSLNADREWTLEATDHVVSSSRLDRIREKKEPEPICCPKCHAIRLSGPVCASCGYQHVSRSRPVLQTDGTLRDMRNDQFSERRLLPHDTRVEQSWVNRVKAIRKSTKPTVQRMTFAMVEANIARENNNRYAPRTLPLMPKRTEDWFRRVCDVPLEDLS